jgi:hypothetical protein
LIAAHDKLNILKNWKLNKFLMGLIVAKRYKKVVGFIQKLGGKNKVTL